MWFLRQMPLFTFLILTMSAHSAHAIMSYHEWKHAQVLQEQNKMQNLKTQIESKKALRQKKTQVAKSIDPNMAKSKELTEANLSADAQLEKQIEKIEHQIQEEQYTLDLVNDLTVSDYFAGYLTKMRDKKAAFNEVAGKLSPEEVAELMNAYANSVFDTKPSDLPASATNTTRDTVK